MGGNTGTIDQAIVIVAIVREYIQGQLLNALRLLFWLEAKCRTVSISALVFDTFLFIAYKHTDGGDIITSSWPRDLNSGPSQLPLPRWDHCCCCRCLWWAILILNAHALAQPDRTFHYLRALKSTDSYILCTSETSADAFSQPAMAKCFVGQFSFQHSPYCINQLPLYLAVFLFTPECWKEGERKKKRRIGGMCLKHSSDTHTHIYSILCRA